MLAIVIGHVVEKPALSPNTVEVLSDILFVLIILGVFIGILYIRTLWIHKCLVSSSRIVIAYNTIIDALKIEADVSTDDLNNNYVSTLLLSFKIWDWHPFSLFKDRSKFEYALKSLPPELVKNLLDIKGKTLEYDEIKNTIVSYYQKQQDIKNTNEVVH